jgi:hypothetical protein
MSITLVEPVEVASPFAVKWTRADCQKFEAAGVLTYRYELVNGAINRMGQGIPHRNSVIRLLFWLAELFGQDYLQTQAAIDVSPVDNPTNEPEPDVALLSVPLSSLTQNPSPEQVRLVVEVSDTTLRYDLTTKAVLYARAEIIEYWVLSLNERKLYIHRNPVQGQYQAIHEYDETETVALLAASDTPVRVENLLP